MALEPQTETVSLFLGSATSPDLIDDLSITLRGYVLGAVGDVNGDGLSDFAIGHPGAGGDEGRVEVYFGASTPDGTPDWILSGNPGEHLGYSIASAGDVNGDGYDDILVGGRGSTGRLGSLYLGGEQPDSVPDLFFEAEPGTAVAGYRAMTGVGDLDQDGRVDIALGDWLGTGATHVFTTDVIVDAQRRSMGGIKEVPPMNPGRRFYHCIILVLAAVAGAPSVCAAQDAGVLVQRPSGAGRRSYSGASPGTFGGQCAWTS